MDPGQMSEQGQSTSGQNSLDHIRHPVFLSHSGKQKPFVWDLFQEFQGHARFLVEPPFFDQERASLPKGKEFPDRIFKAAKTCDVAVVILTKEYLTSKWPMLELITFIDALKTTKSDMYLIPVFFGLSKADISHEVIEHRWILEWEKLIGSSSASWDIFGFSSACSRIAARCYSWLIGPRSRPSNVPGSPLPLEREKMLLTVDSCKEALQMLRKRNGLDAEKYQSHGLLRKAIVKEALEALPASILPVDTDDMQGRDRLCQVISRMFKERDGIHCLGLYGMGGSGKTTVCTALCRYFEPDFNDKVYHLEIGSNDNGKKKLVERHKELLRKLIGLSEEDVNKIRDPSSDLRLHLGKQPVFLAVDNVQEDSCEEAQNYLNYLCKGSKIIFTARSRATVEIVLESWIYCQPIPNLERAEAMSLILKIAAPRRKRDTLDKYETRILHKCLLICLFPLQESADIGTKSDFISPHGFMTRSSKVEYILANREIGGHYHPLALQAVASYFKHLKQNEISDWKSELDKNSRMIFYSSQFKTGIFDVLGIGFNNNKIENITKQIFIDVALYAPSPTNAEDIYNWLVAIRAPLKPKIIEMKLQTLRTLSFLDYVDGSPEQTAPTCMNIRMHELYREYAKRYVNSDDSYPYGVYYDHCETQPVLTSSGWATVPRIHLRRWGCPIKVTYWRCVSVIHLYQCDTLNTFAMGPELVNLRCLTIFQCSQLVSLSWTKKHKRSMTRLTFVELAFNDNLETLPDFSTCPELRTVSISFNKSLKTLPDFCTCPELRSVLITECSSSVNPLSLRNCSKLKFLLFLGKNAPEILNLESCPKLKSARLVWKASGEGLLNNLPSMSELTIEGPSSVPSYMADNIYDISHPVPAHKLFCKHHPQETICFELSGVWKQNDLRNLQLKYIPMGCLPLGLETSTIAPNLKHLNLEGCLLSRWVDFSFFPNLQHLSIMRTNVQKISGVRSLKNLVSLDCSFCFRLRKIPDLRSLPALKYVFLAQNPDLKAIPRLPQGCCELGTEDSVREALALRAFASTAKSALPPPLFAIKIFFENPTKLMENAAKDALLLLGSLLSRGRASIHYGSNVMDVANHL